jgi:hypothetical protein
MPRVNPFDNESPVFMPGLPPNNSLFHRTMHPANRISTQNLVTNAACDGLREVNQGGRPDCAQALPRFFGKSKGREQGVILTSKQLLADFGIQQSDSHQVVQTLPFILAQNVLPPGIPTGKPATTRPGRNVRNHIDLYC